MPREVAGQSLRTLFGAALRRGDSYDEYGVASLLGDAIDDPVELKLTVNDARSVVDCGIGGRNLLALSIDRYFFESSDQSTRSRPFIEIECEYTSDGIESAFERARQVSSLLKKQLRLTQSPASKYQQGLLWLDSSKARALGGRT